MYYYPRNKDFPHAAQVPNRKVPINMLTVQGEGEINVRPDQAKVTLGVVTENIDVQTAQQENATISNSVIQALQQLGIEEASIRTTAYTVFPRYDYIEGKSILRGYEVEHQLEILIKNLEIIGIVYETAISHGAKKTGRCTSCTAAAIRCVIDISPPARATCRRIFSTITTEPSTTMPKSSAPSESRLAGMFVMFSRMDANSRENGIVAATISALRTFPRNRNNTTLFTMN